MATSTERLSVELRHESDLGDGVASQTCRWILFLSFCQALQMFLSYAGGALPVCVDDKPPGGIPQETGLHWTESEIGMLGSWEMLGTTVVSILWGRALQHCRIKPLLAFGLCVNCALTMLFTYFETKYAMYAVRFLIGIFESLQMVWATAWTVSMAPPDWKAVWLGCGAVAAMLGTGLGQSVAGVVLQEGFSYRVVFMVQGVALGGFCLGLMLTPPAPLKITKVEHRTEEISSTRALLSELLRNKVYCWTTLTISLVMFGGSGIQYLWVRVFTHMWDLPEEPAAFSFLIVTGIGSGVGIAFGPYYIDRVVGGLGEIAKCLKVIFIWGMFSVIASVLGVMCLFGKLFDLGSVFDGVWPLWICIASLFAFNNAGLAALVGISVEVVPEDDRSFAVGVQMAVRQVFGYTCGPFLPGVVMDVSSSIFGWESRSPTELCAGFVFVLLTAILACPFLYRALVVARRSADAALLAARRSNDAADQGVMARPLTQQTSSSLPA